MVFASNYKVKRISIRITRKAIKRKQEKSLDLPGEMSCPAMLEILPVKFLYLFRDISPPQFINGSNIGLVDWFLWHPCIILSAQSNKFNS